MKYNTIKKIADHVKDLLNPYCERIEIAGSIRRKCEDCGDIEIVCTPKEFELVGQPTLFADVKPMRERSETFVKLVDGWKPVRGDARAGKWMQRIIEPPYLWEIEGLGFVKEEVKLDIFTATPDNWGLMMAIRTGNGKFSYEILGKAWVKQGYHSVNGMLVRESDNKLIPVREEKHLFEYCHLNYLEPEKRNF